MVMSMLIADCILRPITGKCEQNCLINVILSVALTLAKNWVHLVALRESLSVVPNLKSSSDLMVTDCVKQ